MILRKLTASFGGLNRDTLELHQGLNIISAPNESGKSTWTEFLLAMLYGVDTGERHRQGGPIPVKERCRPWNGNPMEGTVELEWEGKRLTLERTGTAKAPMARFRAYDTDSGLPEPELDGKNCGRRLLGVERTVYERSGFIRQRGIGVTGDASLEQRLGALVTTGEEDYAYAQVEKQLRDMKNRCKHNKTGLIPAAEEELAQVQRQLGEIRAVQEQLAFLQGEKQALEERQKELARGAAALKARELRQKQARISQAETAWTEAVRRRQEAETQCSHLPTPGVLAELSRSLTALDAELQTARMEAAFITCEKEKPAPPAAFADMDPEKALSQAGKDKENYVNLTIPVKPQSSLLLILGLVLLALGGVTLGGLLFAWQHILFGAGLALAGGVLVALWLAAFGLKKRRITENRHQAELILTKYGVEQPEAITELAEAYSAQSRAYEEALAQTEEKRRTCQDQLAALERRQAALFGRISNFAPQADSLAACKSAVEAGCKAYAALETARREENLLSSQLEALRQMAGQQEAPFGVDTEEFAGLDQQTLQQQTQRCSAQLLAVRSRLDECRGRLSGLGEPLALEAQKEQLTRRLEELNRKNSGLALAMETLEAANREVQSRFSPMVCREASRILSRLTGGKYEKLLLQTGLSVTVQPTGDAVMRPCPALSCGTADQVYLAVRLAICHLLLPGAPLVLDDALVAFDDERAGLAMEVLRQEAQQRQVILFTCQGRELRL